jgi:transposase InsO family protein
MYQVLKTSRQAFHAKLDRYMRRQEQYHQLTEIIRQFREDHPKMSLRDAYIVIQPEGIGRDRFEQYLKSQGFGVGRKRSFRRTTNSLGVIRFDNLIEGLELTHVNQIWVSDITYFQIGDKFYYLTFIMDLYSRRILGYHASDTLLTQYTTIPALLMAFQVRGSTNYPGLIIHSDGGGQYYCKEFRKLTEAASMINSMGKTVYENPHAERVNGIIKNNYLVDYAPNSLKDLRKKLKKAVRMYNEQKPHLALNKLNPVDFEKQVLTNDVESENNLPGYFPLPTSNHDKNKEVFLNIKPKKTVNVF